MELLIYNENRIEFYHVFYLLHRSKTVKCKIGGDNTYLCIMKTEINIPEHFPALKEEDLKAADERRDKYTLIRDLQAKEFNEAILIRLAKEKEKSEHSQSEDSKPVKCKNCGKEFSVEIADPVVLNCPECS